jgi:hypothetical protein
MRNKFFTGNFSSGLIVLLFFLLLSGCSPKKTTDEHGKSSCMKPDSINPNGSSELAKLMRNMHSHASLLRDYIINDRTLDTFPVSFQKIYTAKATDSTVRSNAFDKFSENYLNRLQNLYSVKDGASRKHAFNEMVDQCISCHNQYCTGPVKVISKLKIGEAEK